MEPLGSILSSRTDRKRREQKPRVLLSCTWCREKKVKCNRGRPCANCLRRGQDTACQYITERSRRPVSGEQEPHEVYRRLRYLEQKLLRLEKAAIQDHSSTPEHVALDGSAKTPDADAANDRSQAEAESAASPRPGSVSGCLLSETSGTRFISPSHWQAMMNNAELNIEDRSVNYGQGAEETESSPDGPVLLLGISHQMDEAELLAALPPRNIADMLVRRCLVIIHVPTFKSEYLEFWKDPSGVSLAWLALLYSILSCAIYIEHTTNPEDTNPQLPGTFHVYRTNCAIALAKANFATPGRYKVDAAIMYLGVEYLQSNNLKTGISMLLGVVSRLAIMMGYHREPRLYHPQISCFEAEMRRRAWLLLVSIDSKVAWQTGLPRVIPRKLGDVTLPRNLLDSDFGLDTTVLPPSRSVGQHVSNIAYISALEQMLFVVGEVTDTVSGGAMVSDTAQGLSLRLEKIKSSLPSIFQLQPREAQRLDDGKMIERYCLEITYQRARCILYRRYLTTARSDPHRKFRSICVDAARQILALQSELFQGMLAKSHSRHRAWFGLSRSISDCLTATMVICLEVINQSRDGSSSNDHVRTELIELLKSSHMSWKLSPRPSLETIKAAEITSTVLDLLGANRVDVLPPLSGKEEGQGSPTELTENLTSPNIIQDMLVGDSALEMFDWALWDREMQQLQQADRVILQSTQLHRSHVTG
ncbi:hypothetical protein BDQ94DRAFT_184483 [Aspergillus welwitschiae]|uniref:Zn(2)-C6 fungal-type domain-containing protein n=1 Tax=Aspergillus welwitschiae TaxID=1341132 RepID=A0A3F3PKT6_9EURO|nr:hypothetical protein BDQ94DRAFT_184483 [Aspergillus welwitschiae]RDH27529.1 hypothetical protein BDQ94DRAFT_184483 [Aspergillus welwitschiae]